MKLDNNLLRQMIAEALEEIALRKGTDQASKHASQDEKKNGKDEKDKKDRERRKAANTDTSELPDWMTKESIEEAISDVEIERAKEETKEADALAADKAEKLASLEADKAKQALGESFQLTKGRLRQIISEELISAKKQGIL